MRKFELTKCSHLSLGGNEFLLPPAVGLVQLGPLLPFFFLKCQIICFLFTFAHRVDGVISLALFGVPALGLSYYLPIAALSACGGMLMGDRDAPGDIEAGTQCSKGDAQGWGIPLLWVREGEEVALQQSVRARKAGLQQEPAILTSLLMKNISAVQLPHSLRHQCAFWFSDGCCRTFYFTIAETKLESIFNPFPFCLAAFPCHPAVVLIPQKLGQGLGEAKGRVGCPSLQQEDYPSLYGPFAQRSWLRPSQSGLCCEKGKIHGCLPFSSFSFSRKEDFFFSLPGLGQAGQDLLSLDFKLSYGNHAWRQR